MLKKSFLLCAACGTLLNMSSCANSAKAAAETTASDTDSLPVVYYIEDITPDNIVKIYKALGRKA
ncbi:MAG: ferredoxin, partial [Muribaculum sp.]|nr:ferredoxin [Muribaculum sp.]